MTRYALRAIVLGAAMCALAPGRAGGWPMLPARPVPNAIAGAADPHPAAAFYNPAALGPLRGVRIWWDAGARAQLGSIARDAGSAAVPIQAPSVDGFFGLTWDFFSDRFTAGIAILSPFNELGSFPASSPVRYHSIWSRMATLTEVVSVGVRVSSRFFIGAGATFHQSWADLRYARDLAPSGGSAAIDQPSALCGGQACGLENPLATQDVRLRGFGWGAGLNAGILARPIDRMWLAVSYFSRPLAPYDGLADARGASVRPAPGSPDPGCGAACVGSAFLDAVVPDILTFGVRVEATPRLEIEGTTRWVHYGQREALDVSLQGGTLDRLGRADPIAAVPTQQRYGRGWRDAVLVGVSFRVRVGERVRLQPSLAYESNAVDPARLSAANLDGHKLDLALTLEWRPREHLVVGAHLGGLAYLVGRGGQAYDPRAEASCVDAAYDVRACTSHFAGTALPAASGRYTMGGVHGGFALGMEY